MVYPYRMVMLPIDPITIFITIVVNIIGLLGQSKTITHLDVNLDTNVCTQATHTMLKHSISDWTIFEHTMDGWTHHW